MSMLGGGRRIEKYILLNPMAANIIGSRSEGCDEVTPSLDFPGDRLVACSGGNIKLKILIIGKNKLDGSMGK